MDRHNRLHGQCLRSGQAKNAVGYRSQCPVTWLAKTRKPRCQATVLSTLRFHLSRSSPSRLCACPPVLGRSKLQQ